VVEISEPDASTASAAAIRPIIRIFMVLMFAKSICCEREIIAKSWAGRPRYHTETLFAR
jgi:hypothetical protein